MYYRGPLEFRGSPPAVRIHLNRDETIVFPVNMLPINHSYSDQNDLPHARLNVYSLEEILVEKLRAFSSQRKFAIARDIYDIYHLVQRQTDVVKSINALGEKCAVKNIDIKKIDLNDIMRRKEEYKLNWENNLLYLVPQNLKISFDEAWNLSTGLLKQALQK